MKVGISQEKSARGKISDVYFKTKHFNTLQNTNYTLTRSNLTKFHVKSATLLRPFIRQGPPIFQIPTTLLICFLSKSKTHINKFLTMRITISHLRTISDFFFIAKSKTIGQSNNNHSQKKKKTDRNPSLLCVCM